MEQVMAISEAIENVQERKSGSIGGYRDYVCCLCVYVNLNLKLFPIISFIEILDNINART